MQIAYKIPDLAFLGDLHLTTEITVFNNGNYVMIAMEPFKMDVPGINGNENEDRDTLFFDTNKRIVYHLNDRMAYRYVEPMFKFRDNNTDTMVSSRNDTSIVVSKSLSNKVTGNPRLGNLPHGMKEYKTDKLFMKLLDYKKSGYNLEAIMQRVKSYKLSDTPFQWSF